MNPAKKSFLLLVFVFLFPVLIGSLMYLFKDRLGLDSATTNYGTLIRPALPLNAGGLLQNGKEALAEETIARKWTLLYLVPTTCEKHCKDRILLMHRVRLLMNENMRRVRILAVTQSAVEPKFSEEVGKHYSSLVISSVPDTAVDAKEDRKRPFMAQFPHRESAPLYLLDPLGNLMMYYPQENPDAKRMIRDLQRLLKYSHLG